MVINAEAPVTTASQATREPFRRPRGQQRMLQRCVKNLEWTTTDTGLNIERLPELTTHVDPLLTSTTLNPHAPPFIPTVLQDVPAAGSTVTVSAPATTSLSFSIAGHMIPHPAKAHKGGEDAYFISDDLLVFGLADGVGGWEALGVDSGLYSRSLMAFCANAVDTQGLHEPFAILKQAHEKSACLQGSTTACVVSLNPATSVLSAVNLGDSGFVIVRNGQLLYRTKEQQHFFNCPFQIGSSRDQPEDAQRLTIEGIQEGDIVLACTDGVFDNLFTDDIVRIIVESTHLGPQAIAKRVAQVAHEVASRGDGYTPFQDGAQKAGQFWRGGKLDDITVLAAIITSQ